MGTNWILFNTKTLERLCYNVELETLKGRGGEIHEHANLKAFYSNTFKSFYFPILKKPQTTDFLSEMDF